jgi:uncharacterized protein YfaS (alpha-2-macroglobulin family)
MNQKEPVVFQMKAWKKILFIFLIFCLSLMPGCKGRTGTETEQPVGPGGIPAIASLTPVPPTGKIPRVEAWTPGDKELIVDGSITVTFSEYMDPASTEHAFHLQDDTDEQIEGQFDWISYQKTLKFTPSQLLSPGRIYQILISESAKSIGGKEMAVPFLGTFYTTNRLEGCTVVPFDGDNNVPSDTSIRVIFPMPIVSEALRNKPGALDEILQIDPPLPGKPAGEWETTSIYRIKPAGMLAHGIRYKVTVLSSRINSVHPDTPVLKGDITWQFQTAAPSVKNISIISEMDPKPTSHFLPGDRIQVKFDQAMERSSVERNVVLWDDNDNKTVPVSYTWEDDNQEVQMAPIEALIPGRGYVVAVLKGTRTQNGGIFLKEERTYFQALPVPGIGRVSPKEEESGKYYESFTIYFRSEMNEESIKDRVLIDPPLPAQAASYDSTMDTFSFRGLQPQVAYTVTVLPGIQDVYGNEMKDPYVARFVNGSKPASFLIQLPIYTPILYRAGGPQTFMMEYTNLKSLDYRIYRLSKEEFLGLYHYTAKFDDIPLGDDRLEWDQAEQNLGKPNETIIKKVDFSRRDGTPLPPGYYLLHAASQPEIKASGVPNWRIFAVVDVNVTYKISAREVLAWVTKLGTGEPVYNARVKLFDINNKPLGESRTDENGLATISMPQPFNPNMSYYAVSDENGFGLAHSNWGTGNLNYDQLSITKFTERADKPVIYLYSDRPIYRPGTTVNYKGVLRLSNDFLYSLPDSAFEAVEIMIEDYSGKRVDWQMRPLSPYKTFEGSFPLKSTAALGNYTVSALINGKIVGKISFNVAYYREQAFKVQASVDQTHIAAGEKATVHVLSQYYTGGALRGAEVSLEVRKQSYVLSSEDRALAEYVFAEDGLVEAAKYAYLTYVGTYTIQTDNTGNSTQVLPPSPASLRSSEKYSVTATVSDPSGQSIVDTVTFYTHPSQYQVGMRLDSKVSEIGQERTASIILLDWNEQPVSGQKVQLQLLRQNWMRVEQDVNGQRKSVFSVQKEPVGDSRSATTDTSGRAAISFSVDQGGVYEVRVSAVDGQGKTAAASTTMVAGASNQYIAIKNGTYQNVTLVTDKKEYKVGDPVKLFIQTPFQGTSYALITVERASIKQKEVIRLEGNNREYPLTVLPEWAPNVFVSVMVVKGVDAAYPRPQYAIGSIEIRVNRDSYHLNIDMETDPALNSSEKGMALRIHTSDKQGQPIPAELSLSVIDKATLAGMDPYAPNILDFYYSARQLQVQTNIPMLMLAEEYNYRIENQIPTGESMGGGGLKGGGSLGVMRIRDDFRDTATWQPQIETNENGEAVAYINLPDNLTTWQIIIRGVTRGNETGQIMRVGQKSADMPINRPLFLQTRAPAYFVVGDQVTVGALVHNSTQAPLQAKVSLEAQGASLAEPSMAVQDVTIPASQAVNVQWKIIVSPDARFVNLDFSVLSGEHSDRIRNTQDAWDPRGIPVLYYVSPFTLSMSGVLKSDDEQQAVSFKGDILGNEDLVVQLAPSLFSGMQDSIVSNVQGAAGNTEEIASRVIAAASMVNYLQTLRQPTDDQQKQLQAQIRNGLKNLQDLQMPDDGGWAWLAGQTSQEMPTAYAVMSILSTGDITDPVVSRDRDMVRDKALAFLEGKVQQNRSLRLPQHYNTRAFTLYVLTAAGRIHSSDVNNLYRERETLSTFGRAFLAMAIYQENHSDARLKTLLSELEGLAKTDATDAYWQENLQDDWNWSSNIRTTSIVMQAIQLIQPDHPYIEKAVNWLISVSKMGQWQSGQENAWCTKALTEWAARSGEEQPNYQAMVSLNNRQIASVNFIPASFSQPVEQKSQGGMVLPGQVNHLIVQRSKGPGLLYYSAHSYMQKSVDQIASINDRGITIERKFFRPDDLVNPINQAVVGDLLVVRLEILVSSDLRFVTLEDYIPAGAEAIVWLPGELNAFSEVNSRWKDIYTEAQKKNRYFSFADKNPEKVILYANKLSAGSYEYTYIIRAAMPGVFHLLPAVIKQTYNPEVYGQSVGFTLTLAP